MLRSLLCFLLTLLLPLTALSQGSSKQGGSLIEDRAARKLLQAGDARLELGENEKALEIWASVIERYPRNPIRFEAHLRLADHLLIEKSEFDKARAHYVAASTETNENLEQRAHAVLHTGICYYEAGRLGQCFKVMRDVIKQFPAAPEVNEAYYYIGLGHFKRGHYSRAIEALEKVGTVLTANDSKIEKVEAGKRLYIRIDDKDFAVLDPKQKVKVRCKAKSGDEETVICEPVGRAAAMALGSVVTQLGTSESGNGVLELRGGDSITVTYIDSHTADKTFNEKRVKEVQVVGNGIPRITDGTYEVELQAAVLGKRVHLQITDADHDLTDHKDSLKATVQIHRRKTADEIDEEIATKVASGELSEAPEGETLKDQIDLLKLVRVIPITLRESNERGTFRAAIPLTLSPDQNNAIQASPGQILRLIHEDERHLNEGSRTRSTDVRVIEGNLGEMRVTRTEISDEALRLNTKLRTASALTEVGNHYKEFGLDAKAHLKYSEALTVCENILERAQEVGGELLEETYVQLWRIYFVMDELELALQMSRRLLREFPQSAFIDEAMMKQAQVEQKRGNYNQAINLYSTIAKLPDSDLRGDGQFHVGECYEAMAMKSPTKQSERLFEQAFLAYQKVYENHSESGRVGDAVARMATFYYKKEDYARAIDVFENVIADYPDANFLDVILFNYGRCLYKSGRKDEARRKFDQLIRDFPESDIAPEAKKIVDALQKNAAASSAESSDE